MTESSTNHPDTQFSASAEVDARGLNCPLPILKAKKALASLQSGQILKVVSTDSGSKRDFEAFARQTGNALLHQVDSGTEWSFYLQRR
jgi:tRNA 2-thiouridine synthesizing protein A